MFPLAKTKRILTILIIANLALAVVLGGVYYLLSKQAAATKKTTAKVDRIKRNQTRSQSLQQLVDDTQEARKVLDSMFVQPDGVAEFITTIESTAKGAGVSLSIQDVSLEEPGETDSSSEKELLTELNLSLRAVGNWSQISDFVRKLELLPKSLRFQNASFNQSAGAGDDSAGRWRVQAKLTVNKLTKP